MSKCLSSLMTGSEIVSYSSLVTCEVPFSVSAHGLLMVTSSDRGHIVAWGDTGLGGLGHEGDLDGVGTSPLGGRQVVGACELSFISIWLRLMCFNLPYREIKATTNRDPTSCLCWGDPQKPAPSVENLPCVLWPVPIPGHASDMICLYAQYLANKLKSQ